ncbi:hypothetical protein ACVG87_004460 [Klebsiella aerogenes]
MTDITRLLASLKRRSAHAKKFGDSITFVKLEDIDALVEALEKAQTKAIEQGRTACELFDEVTTLRQRIASLEESHAQVIQSRDHYKRMSEEGLKQLAQSRTVTVKQYDEFQICHYGATEDYAKGYIDCQNNFFKWLTAKGIKWEAE